MCVQNIFFPVLLELKKKEMYFFYFPVTSNITSEQPFTLAKRPIYAYNYAIKIVPLIINEER